MNTAANIQTTLARSYLAYYLFSILGLLADSLIGFDVVIPFGSAIAITCFIVGPALMIWAQQTSNPLKKKHHAVKHEYFLYGPYRYMRNPTHLGLVVLVTGYTAVSGSILFLAVTIIGYVVSNILFRRYEAIVAEKYGEQYEQYKSKVPKIL